jgi:hypothetical protein
VRTLYELLADDLDWALGRVTDAVREAIEGFREQGALGCPESGQAVWLVFFRSVKEEAVRTLEAILKARPKDDEWDVIGDRVTEFIRKAYHDLPEDFPPAWVLGLPPIPSRAEVYRRQQLALDLVEAKVLGQRRLIADTRQDRLLRTLAPALSALLGVIVGYVLRR